MQHESRNSNRCDAVGEKELIYSFSSVRFRVCVLSLGHVQLFTTPWTVACQAPLSMWVLQARILEWVASSRGCSQPRDRIQVSCIAGAFFII